MNTDNKNNQQHLSDEEKALAADALLLFKIDKLDEHIKQHMKECDTCANIGANCK
jgi:ribosomal protein S15P/S13E